MARGRETIIGNNKAGPVTTEPVEGQWLVRCFNHEVQVGRNPRRAVLRKAFPPGGTVMADCPKCGAIIDVFRQIE